MTGSNLRGSEVVGQTASNETSDKTLMASRLALQAERMVRPSSSQAHNSAKARVRARARARARARKRDRERERDRGREIGGERESKRERERERESVFGTGPTTCCQRHSESVLVHPYPGDGEVPGIIGSTKALQI